MRDTVSKPHRRTAELSTAPPDAALSVDDTSFARDHGGSDEMAKVHNVNGKHRHDRIASAEEPCELVELFFFWVDSRRGPGDGGLFSVQSSNEDGWLFSSRR
ncbi:hypothetical protein NW759_007580 [Fusarium solani]|nr:hypothetical protein NW759_007580 [Fusarium solani]